MIFFVADTISSIKGTTIAKQPKVMSRLSSKEKVLTVSSRSSLQKLIKHVIISLSHRWMDQTDFLQEISLDGCTRKLSTPAKVDINILSESWRVVITNCWGLRLPFFFLFLNLFKNVMHPRILYIKPPTKVAIIMIKSSLQFVSNCPWLMHRLMLHCYQRSNCPCIAIGEPFCGLYLQRFSWIPFLYHLCIRLHSRIALE